MTVERFEKLFKSTSLENKVTFPHDLLGSFDISAEFLDEIRELVIKILVLGTDLFPGKNNCKKVDFSRLLEVLRKTKVIKLEKHPDLFTLLEKLLVREISKSVNVKKFKGIEFPVNLRIVHPEPPTGYLVKKNPTDFFHCDPWAGEPEDIVNVLLHVYSLPQSSSINFLDTVDTNHEAIKAYKGSYLSGQPLIKKLPALNLSSNNGRVLIFDPFLPHATRRGLDDIRISIDFRMRINDPYSTLDRNWFHRKIPWSKYWLLPQTGFCRYHEKYLEEIKALTKSGKTKAVHLRKERYEVEK